MLPSQRVLIVDESGECREVLRTALARTGAETVEATTAAEGLAAFQSLAPDLVILDVQDDGGPRVADSWKLQEAARRKATPIVVLGTARRPSGPPSAVHWFAKPYHFAPVIRRIEGLLSARLRSEN